MDLVPFDHFKCSECGRVLTPADWGVDVAGPRWEAVDTRPFCALCCGMFCRSHIVVRKGGAICASCQGEYERIMTRGPITDADESRIVDLLGRDVSITVGRDLVEIIAGYAASFRLKASSRDEYDWDVVDRVQQYIHDDFIDTTWPRCPHHPNHPMWLDRGRWCCTQLGVVVAELGELPEGML